jgi:hypothetical protein
MGLVSLDYWMMLPLLLVIATMLVVRIKKYLNERQVEWSSPQLGKVLDFSAKSRTVDGRTQIWSLLQLCSGSVCRGCCF